MEPNIRTLRRGGTGRVIWRKVRTLLASRPELVATDRAENDEHRGLHYAVLRRDAAMVRLLDGGRCRLPAKASGRIAMRRLHGRSRRNDNTTKSSP